MKFFEELPWRDAFGVELVGGRAPLDLWKVAGGDRLATLAALALDARQPPAPAPRAPLLLCAPDGGGQFVPRDLLAVLCDKLGDAVDSGSSQVFVAGRTAFLDALDEAERLLASLANAAGYMAGARSAAVGLTAAASVLLVAGVVIVVVGFIIIACFTTTTWQRFADHSSFGLHHGETGHDSWSGGDFATWTTDKAGLDRQMQVLTSARLAPARRVRGRAVVAAG